jgi:hypothetical protein
MWKNEWVEYTATLRPGIWFIGINVINRGNLGPPVDGWYLAFQVENDLTNSTIIIPASDTEENFGGISYDVLSGGPVTVRYTWMNDKNEPPLDANIMITSAFFDIPLPGSVLLLASGLMGLMGMRRRFGRQRHL